MQHRGRQYAVHRAVLPGHLQLSNRSATGRSIRATVDRCFALGTVLCKFLPHNLTCLIQEQETLGIVPILRKDEPREPIEAEILPMRRL